MILLLCFSLLFLGCSTELSIPISSEDLSSVPIEIQVNSKEEIFFTNNSRIKIDVYRLNMHSADAPATLLKSYKTNIMTLPSNFKVEFTKDSYKDIGTVRVQHPKDALYYLVVSVDINGDGKLCDGDLDEDYSRKQNFMNSFKGDIQSDLKFNSHG